MIVYIVSLAFLLIVILSQAFLAQEGAWSNLVRIANVIFAGLIAMNFFEPLADLLEGQMSSYTNFYDFLMQWALFCASYGLLSQATKYLSKVQVRFLPALEKALAHLFALVAAWVFILFTSATLYTAPLEPDFDVMITGGRVDALEEPHIKWLAFTQNVSKKAYSQGEPTWVFDPEAEYLLRYQGRRIAIAESGALVSK